MQFQTGRFKIIMTRTQTLAVSALLCAGVLGASWQSFAVRAENSNQQKNDTVAKNTPAKKIATPIKKVVKTEAQWRKILSPAAFNILREEGTEAAFSGDYKSHGKGVYRCAGCDLDLFWSSTKFDSGTGWPSFWKPIANHVIEKKDADGERTEVECARCGGHLGHVFEDGPKPTGLRYCLNSPALKFQKSK